jgi:hypothetical protein
MERRRATTARANTDGGACLHLHAWSLLLNVSGKPADMFQSSQQLVWSIQIQEPTKGQKYNIHVSILDGGPPKQDKVTPRTLRASTASHRAPYNLLINQFLRDIYKISGVDFDLFCNRSLKTVDCFWEPNKSLQIKEF